MQGYVDACGGRGTAGPDYMDTCNRKREWMSTWTRVEAEARHGPTAWTRATAKVNARIRGHVWRLWHGVARLHGHVLSQPGVDGHLDTCGGCGTARPDCMYMRKRKRECKDTWMRVGAVARRGPTACTRAIAHGSG